MRRDVFQAIADPVRRDIIELVSKETLSINNIATQFNISRPAISKHIRILQECGIVTIEKKGRERFCIIQPKNLIPAYMWLNQYRQLWDNRLDSLDQYLITLQTKNKKDEH